MKEINSNSKLYKSLFLIIFVLLFVPVLIFSSTKLGQEIFIIFVGLTIIEAVFEIVGVVGLKRRIPILFASISYPIVVLILVRVFNEGLKWIDYVLLVTVLYLILMFILAILSNGIVRLGQITQIISFSLYFVLSLIAILLLRYNYEKSGNLFYISLFLISIFSNISFKIINIKFGKHKIFKNIKCDFSIEGVIGSIIITFIIEMLHILILYIFFSIKIVWLTYVPMVIICVILSIVAKLIFFYVKKENDMKHFRSFVPDMYGILELFDSTLFICPIMYLIYVGFSPVVFAV